MLLMEERKEKRIAWRGICMFVWEQHVRGDTRGNSSEPDLHSHGCYSSVVIEVTANSPPSVK
jgi:hypothetical protein